MAPLNQIAIVGVGLLGGSIGKASVERQLANQVVGIGRNPEKLARAESLGIAHRTTTDVRTGVADADLVIVCTPVNLLSAKIAEVLAASPPSCLVTDVGSTKQKVVAEVQQLGQASSSRFVGSHPMAGDHRAGADFARADLFCDRLVVLTPTSHTPPEAVQGINQFWQRLGARTMELTPDEHDAAVATTSHVPHAVATALALSTAPELLNLAATGWADTTRIAAGDPKLWREIFMANRQHILHSLDQFQLHFKELHQALAACDADRLEQLLTEGKHTRDALGN